MPTTWVPVPEGSPFPVQNLPYGVVSVAGGEPAPAVAVGERVVSLAVLARRGLFAGVLPEAVELFGAATLNPFLAAGPDVWQAVRERLVELLTDTGARSEVERAMAPLADARAVLPFEVADYVDFYASERHATNCGAIFRPGEPPLTPNWRHLPVGYHGRAGTVVVSGTPVTRPRGQRQAAPGAEPVFGPSVRLDIEAEVGFVVGVPSPLGEPVAIDDFEAHVFGAVLVNDWSARDIQSFEARPLGPFLGKSFATSVSPWVVPLAALREARVPAPMQDPLPLTYLHERERHGYDLALEVALNGAVVSRPPFAALYWTPAQQLAHLTANGASLRTGDLFASGTVSGETPAEFGSLIELTWNGERALTLPDGTTRTFLADGDTVTISASAPGADGVRIGFGEVTGTVVPAARLGAEPGTLG